MASILEVDWSSLPDEVWLSHILKYLTTGSLLRVALVSKKLNKLATDPSLWASKEINLNKARIISERPFFNFLNIPRFTKIKKLDLAGVSVCLDFAEALFEYINSSKCQITAINLSSFNVVDCINIADENFNDNFSFNQNVAHIADALRNGDLQDPDKIDLDENLVGKAIAKLEDSKLADFMRFKRSPRFTLPILQNMMTTSPRFALTILENVLVTSHHQSLDLTGFDFGLVSPTLFSSAIASLRRVKLVDCPGLTSEHMTALFAFLANQESASLSLLFIAGIRKNVMPENSPLELGLGISKLEHLHLAGNRKLDPAQALAVLGAVPTSSLQSLSIGMDFRGVPMEIIRNAVLHLNPGANDEIPHGCNTIDEQFKIYYLLFGKDEFSW